MKTNNKGKNKLDEQAKSPVNVFISHASEDKQVAKEIAARLREHGFETWLDVHAMRAGDNLRAAIDKAINEADAALVLVSKNSASSAWVALEWPEIREHTWERSDLKVLPVLLDDAELPPFLREWRAMRFEKNGAEKIAQRVENIVREKSDTRSSKENLSKTEIKELKERFREMRKVFEKAYNASKGEYTEA